MDRDKSKYFAGCLLGGAVGDALGWPVEFDAMAEIIKRFGVNGIVDLVPGENGLYEITDDTQMTLFTAEGLLRTWTTACQTGEVPDFTATVRHSYRCWLKTQSESVVASSIVNHCDGWLLSVVGLHRRRAPGDTCLSALREGVFSENDIADNFSKGCGGVMRVAPAGLLAARIINNDSGGAARLAFDIGCVTATITHGHPSGYYPAGALAAIIATVITGGSLEDGTNFSLNILDGRNGAEETAAAIHAAVNLWRDKSISPSSQTIETLGGGWTGDEALAIGLYSALTAGDDFKRGVRLAVNHSGDSDSTGSITGNIMGALLGENAIPRKWLNRLELADVIRQVGNDMFTTFEKADRWLKNYPPFPVTSPSGSNPAVDL